MDRTGSLRKQDHQHRVHAKKVLLIQQFYKGNFITLCGKIHYKLLVCYDNMWSICLYV